MFPHNIYLKNLPDTAIEKLATAAYGIIDSMEPELLRDFICFDMQNFIIKHNGIETYFGKDNHIEFNFFVLKNLIDGVIEAAKLCPKR